MIRIATLKIVYGAPCSGKSTYVTDNITDKDIKFDFDEILAAISNSSLHDNREELIDYGTEIRGLLIEKAANDSNIDTAYIITCKITDKLLEQLGEIEAEYILIEKSKEEIFEQLENDDTREDKEHWKALINEWFEWYEGYENKQQTKAVMLLNQNIKPKRMWEFKQSTQPNTLELYIYGYVEGDYYDWWTDQEVKSETSANHFRDELTKHSDVEQINIYINSYGGSVYEGTAIYSQLKRHPAQKTVYIDGFACSIASIIAMAGDKVVMPKNTLMMIHDIWNWVCGNAKQLRKAADDLDVIMEGNRQAYLQKSKGKITEEKLIKMLEEETWLTADMCLEYGFCDEILEKEADLTDAKQMLQKVNQSMDQHLSYNKALAAQYKEMFAKEPEPAPKKTPPKDNKPKNLMAALFAAKER